MNTILTIVALSLSVWFFLKGKNLSKQLHGDALEFQSLHKALDWKWDLRDKRSELGDEEKVEKIDKEIDILANKIDDLTYKNS